MRRHRLASHSSLRRLAVAVLLLVLCAATAPVHGQGADPDLATLAEAVRLRDAGQHAEAITKLETLIATYPKSPAPHFHLGLAQLMAGAPQRAIAPFEVAAETMRLRPAALYNLACAQARAGQAEAAITALGKAVDAGFGDVAAARQDPDLATIRDDARFKTILARAGRPWSARLQFWVGEWDCYSARTGALAGRNTFTRRQDGTVIHEAWRAEGSGGAGESWNCFDRARGVWRQMWVDGGGNATDFTGIPKEKGVLFEATRPDALGRTERIRMFVRPIDAGRVQQTGTRSLDGGKTWQPRYDLIYVPKGQPFAP